MIDKPIAFERVGPRTVPAVSDLQVHDHQEQYVGPVSRIVERARETDHMYAVRIEECVVGFFIIDTAYGDAYDFARPNEVGLRAFLIDRRYQGRGYCRAALSALIPYLEREYPAVDGVVLTVNRRNPRAVACYERGGFALTGETYRGGSAGPQYIMRRAFGPRSRP